MCTTRYLVLFVPFAELSITGEFCWKSDWNPSIGLPAKFVELENRGLAALQMAVRFLHFEYCLGYSEGDLEFVLNEWPWNKWSCRSLLKYR
ncbi:unnamed protein product [Blepharisma stoltei]|uniref:Uncharacterized protein n=1 Tax=Blepharisma stoltei TaxID=1481888 RepID=A0AAU9JBE7_9CILI|nr:unnamed protein product [Blepharisma stoltei]